MAQFSDAQIRAYVEANIGDPAAIADAASPPATENARGKLLAAKIATTPSGTFILRISGRGAGE